MAGNFWEKLQLLNVDMKALFLDKEGTRACRSCVKKFLVTNGVPAKDINCLLLLVRDNTTTTRKWFHVPHFEDWLSFTEI